MRNRYYDRKKKVLVVCLAGAQSLLRPEKKKVLAAIVIFVLVQLELNLIQIRQFNFNISITYKVDTYNTRDTNHTTLICT